MALNSLKDIFLQKEKDIYSYPTGTQENRRLGVPDTYDIGQSKARFIVKSLKENAIRITNWWKSGDGIKFGLIQQGLYLMNPKVDSKALIPATRIFNPAKFTANYLGANLIHLTNHGLLTDYDYSREIKDQLTSDGSTGWNTLRTDNKLVKLGTELGLINLTANTPLSSRPPVPGEPMLTISGLAGPNSIFGLGMTNFRVQTSGQPLPIKTDWRYPYTLMQNNPYGNIVINNESSLKILKDKISLFTYDDSAGGNIYNGYNDANKTVIFQTYEDLKKNDDDINHPFTDKNKFNEYYSKQQPGFKSGGKNIVVDTNFKYLNLYSDIKPLPDSGIVDFQNFEKLNNGSPATDKVINSLGHTNTLATRFTNKQVSNTPGSYYKNWNQHALFKMPKTNEADPANKSVGETFDDFITFRFDDDVSGTLQFRCTISGLHDSLKPSWDGVEYIGRPDPVNRYNGVIRTISFSFMIVVLSASEQDVIWQKITRLCQKVSPVVINGKQTAPIVNLTIGKYLINQPGFIDSLDIEVPDEMPWDIVIQKPMGVTINLGFTVIGTESPSSTKKYFV